MAFRNQSLLNVFGPNCSPQGLSTLKVEWNYFIVEIAPFPTTCMNFLYHEIKDYFSYTTKVKGKNKGFVTNIAINFHRCQHIYTQSTNVVNGQSHWPFINHRIECGLPRVSEDKKKTVLSCYNAMADWRGHYVCLWLYLPVRCSEHGACCYVEVCIIVTAAHIIIIHNKII